MLKYLATLLLLIVTIICSLNGQTSNSPCSDKEIKTSCCKNTSEPNTNMACSELMEQYADSCKNMTVEQCEQMCQKMCTDMTNEVEQESFKTEKEQE